MLELYFKFLVIEEIIGWIIISVSIIGFCIWLIHIKRQFDEMEDYEHEERRKNDGRTFTDIRDN